MSPALQWARTARRHHPTQGKGKQGTTEGWQEGQTRRQHQGQVVVENGGRQPRIASSTTSPIQHLTASCAARQAGQSLISDAMGGGTQLAKAGSGSGCHPSCATSSQY